MTTPSRAEQRARRKTLRPHHTRDEIIDVMRLYGRPLSPNQIADVTGRSLGSISYHVRTLLAAGVVELVDEARVRGAVEHFYGLVPGEQVDPLVDPTRLLLAVSGRLTSPDPEGGLPRPTEPDETAKQELTMLVDSLREQVEKILARSVERQCH